MERPIFRSVLPVAVLMNVVLPAPVTPITAIKSSLQVMFGGCGVERAVAESLTTNRIDPLPKAKGRQDINEAATRMVLLTRRIEPLEDTPLSPTNS